MSLQPFSTFQAPPVQVSASLEPVRNVLLSMWALTSDIPLPVDAWIAQAAGQTPPDRREFNRLLFAAFGAALMPDDAPADFDSYLTGLANMPPEVLHSKAAAAVAPLEDAALHSRAEQLLTEPAALQQEIVAHLSVMWRDVFAAEWRRHAFTLTGMTNSINEVVFSQPRWQAMGAYQALRFLLQTEPHDDQIAQLAGVRRIVLVWSPHFLAWCSRFDSPDTLWVMRKFDPQLMRRDPLNRAEVLLPLGALTDDTRLRILELLMEKGEQRAQELIKLLEGSQGNVSRHLKQLVGAGFVRERRGGDANKHYEYDANGVQRLLFLLRQLLSVPNAESAGARRAADTRLQGARAAAPSTLHDFVDEHGRITRWSSKLKDQQVMLEYLAAKFTPERVYNEREVNELLQQWYLDADYVLVRRSMVDAGLLSRTKDGARYWRSA